MCAFMCVMCVSYDLRLTARQRSTCKIYIMMFRELAGIQYREMETGTGSNQAVSGSQCEISYVVYRLAPGAYFKYSSGGESFRIFSTDLVLKQHTGRCKQTCDPPVLQVHAASADNDASDSAQALRYTCDFPARKSPSFCRKDARVTHYFAMVCDIMCNLPYA
jgi:hypothetical protein